LPRRPGKRRIRRPNPVVRERDPAKLKEWRALLRSKRNYQNKHLTCPREGDDRVQLDKDQVEKGVQALLDQSRTKRFEDEFLSKKEKTKDLFDDEANVLLCISLFSPPKVSSGIPTGVTVPHSINPDNCDICLIVPDGLKKKLKNENLPNVKKIIELHSVRAKYHQFEARRKLLGSYDLFLCSRKIKFTLRGLLGSSFIRARRFPIPIGLKNRPECISAALNFVASYSPRGTCALVRIGKLSQTKEEITQNIIEAALPIVQSYKKEWKDVQSLSVKIADSISFPIYYATEIVYE